MTDVRFLHPSGELTLRELDVRVTDDVARVRGVVDQQEWERIESQDIFGARSRRRVPSELTGEGEVRVTIEGPVDALDTGWQPNTDSFVIVDAMREIDNEELRAAGLEGRAWQGVLFTAPAAWTRSVEALGASGFMVADEGDDTVSLTRDDGTRVDVLALDESLAVTVEVRVELDGFDAAHTADVLEALNAFNVAFPVSTNCLDGTSLLTKAGIPILEGNDLPGLIESLATGLVQVSEHVRGPVARLGAGYCSTAQALDDLLG